MDKKKLLRIIITAILLVAAVVVEKTMGLEVWQLLLVYLVPFLLIGYDVIGEAVEGIMKGELFDENFLMCIATIGALLIGFLPNADTEFPEAVFVMLFFQIGELFEDRAKDNSRRSISHLTDIRPDTANVLRNGQLAVVKPEEVRIGETIVVKPGEKIPLDGKVVEGSTTLDTSALTGESMPRSANVGDNVASGCINLSGVINMKVEKTYEDSTVSKILDLVEYGKQFKSEDERFITEFARIYTPVVVGIALLVAFIPPFFQGDYIESLPIWLSRALTFLVVSCPCALVISVPLTYFAGVGGASRRGILVKGSCYMDTLARTSTVVFDKTGTLTYGTPEVVAAESVSEVYVDDEVYRLAACAEQFSEHPLGKAIVRCYKRSGAALGEAKDFGMIPGRGVRAVIDGRTVLAGNPELLRENGVELNGVSGAQAYIQQGCTVTYVAVDGTFAGYLALSDTQRKGSAETISALSDLGVRPVLLTGDHENAARTIADQLHIGEVRANCLPEDKLKYIG